MSALCTDFYELTMMQGYFVASPDSRAVFELFFRHQPFGGGYTVFAGIVPFIEEVARFRFHDDDIAFLQKQGIFKKDFTEYLKNFHFQGDIYSLAEGTIAFPNEPLVRVEGTLLEVQVIESLLLNSVNFQSLIATKTARVVNAAGGLPVLEFGLRRAQGFDGALSASRAAYVGGASATSNTLAGKLYNIPVSGTMAHSWVMSFDSELEAFQVYAKQYPDRIVLLVDTYDTLRSGIPNAIKVFRGLHGTKPSLMAIRIDSGDLEYLSKAARRMLDDAGLMEVKIFVSSDMDEWIIEHLRNANCPIDAWGVGTRMVTGWGDPALSGVYKIVARWKDGKWHPCIKLSNQPEKLTNPGMKNIMRVYGEDGQMKADLLYLEEEKEELEALILSKKPLRFNHPISDFAGFEMDDYAYTESLLVPVMIKGKPISNLPSLDDARKRCRDQMRALDATYKRLLNPHVYKVSLSDKLAQTKRALVEQHRKALGKQ
ncbi:MAG: nicotinate phosphoribosyltransferase [Spirochaetes bacterium]|nr:nicotinate phosphoribosyltransferase [Spirochaetota bacterium]